MKLGEETVRVVTHSERGRGEFEMTTSHCGKGNKSRGQRAENNSHGEFFKQVMS